MSQEQHDNSVPKALRPHCWAPGQSGNPAGRPRGTSLRAALRARLGEPASPSDPRPAVEAVVDALYRAAIEDRDVRAMRLLIESVDGRAPLVVQHATDDPREMELSELGEVVAHFARVGSITKSRFIGN